MILKTKLLETACFEDNIWLNLYIDLINNNMNTKQEKFKTQIHHIIPRSYFKILNMKIDNSKENLVNLVYKDHLLAHYYLVQCVTNKLLLYKLEVALNYMINISFKRYKLNINELDLDNYQNIYENWKFTESQKQRGSTNIKSKEYMKNTIWINNGFKEHHIQYNDLDKYIELGWKRGRISNKGKPSWNKGLKNIYIGHNKGKTAIYKDGMLKYISIDDLDTYRLAGWSNHGCTKSNESRLKLSESRKGLHYINKNFQNKMIKDIDIEKYLAEGWVIGRFYKHKESYYRNKNKTVSNIEDGQQEAQETLDNNIDTDN